MSSLIHAVGQALTGHGENAERKASVHTIVCDDVKVKSTVSSETQSKASIHHANHKINDLMSKLSSTHAQIDEYSRSRNHQISEAVQSSIERIVHEAKVHQHELLEDTQKRSNEIEEEYKAKLMLFLNQLDEEKAATLVKLEKELNLRQEIILESARKRIDALNEEANRLKMNIFKEAQAQANMKIEEIADKVAHLGVEDATRCLKSTTTTVITTKSHTEGHANDAKPIGKHF
ncbi:unnamed protein product [Rotaria magnacalcarata]|uniref:Uncharacterized protein n=1 Tax=Rotaria magnacalcarata TaxID=392030 RepID=A0A816P876_9BILA|nr:unnamed protein product [Rotaria magnacalcarata]CAF1647927.1 unnamed protein product [Rotaria magnacalcarata]CAF2045598.1 unnamed protein product [Rotaria magnacalcarata]CAF2057013.1 unnamed protein product [Rotaria magnacalcarata]CAF2122629.1 unnamed protein product [Rotaria magnacalcarata]